MSKIEYFYHVINEFDKFRHLACIQKENRNAVAYDCRDNSNSKSHRVPIPFIINEKKFSNRCSFSKAKGKTKLKHEV